VETIDKLQLQLQDLSFTTSQKHSNKMMWTGAVTKVGVPSDGTPGGGTVPVVWERSAVEAAVNTMVDMPLNCEYPEDFSSNPALAFTGHNMRFVIGAVQKAWIEGDYLMCSGIIYKDNFPDVAWMISNAKDSLGFSVELYPKEKKIEDDGFEHVYKLEFTGLTTCWSSVAAFEDTFFTQLVATRIKNKKVDDTMTPEEMKAMLEGFTQSMTAEIAKVQSSVEAKVSALEEKLESEKLEAAKKAEEEKLHAAKVAEDEKVAKLEAEKKELEDKLKAAAIPAPQAVQTAASKVGDVDYTAELSKINQMTCSVSDKVKLRASLALKATAVQ
jgi:hypothetical protein